MTKKTLQGIATGILLTTLLFTYNFYFTDNFYVIKEIPSEEKVNFTEQDFKEYLQNHNLVVIDKLEYEQLLEERNTIEEVEVKVPATPEKSKEKVVKEITFNIEPGMSSSSIALHLKEKGLISDNKLFEKYIINNGLETKLKAGEYLLRSDMSLEEIVKKLT